MERADGEELKERGALGTSGVVFSDRLYPQPLHVTGAHILEVR
jgi:hypothetical protein